MVREPQSIAGGIFIAIALVAGAVIGGIKGQPTIGVLAGAAAGIGIAVLLWMLDRIRVGH